MSNSIKKICLNGLGLALFIVFAYIIRVPVFENYYLCLGYIVMTVYCYSVNIISGTIVGTFGVVLYCILTGGLRGMPGWALGNLILGLIMGMAFKQFKKLKKSWLEMIFSVIMVIIGTAIAMLVVKSLVECFLYSQPFLVRTANNIYAFIADSFIIVVSLPICKFLDPKLRKIMRNE